MCEYGFHCPDPDTCDKTTPPEPTSERYYAWWGGRVIELVPGSAEYQDCPACDDEWQGGSLDTVAVHLNDDHKWKREQIADWLDALPIDLRVVAPSGEKQSITLADLIREGCEDTSNASAGTGMSKRRAPWAPPCTRQTSAGGWSHEMDRASAAPDRPLRLPRLPAPAR